MVIHCESQKEQKLIEEKVLMVRGEGSDGEVLAVRAAQNMIHMISLEKFDNNINSLAKVLKGNRKLLASYGESES